MKILSIVVPNFNGAEKTLKLVSCLLPQLKPDCEIIIVDDGSTPQSLSHLEAGLFAVQCAKLITQENLGRSAARNAGAALAKGEYLIFIDNDIIPGGGFVERVEAVLSVHPHAWITGSVVQKIIECPHKDFLRFRKRLDYVPRDVATDSMGLARVNSFSTQQLAVCRQTFLRLGGFDERLSDCEDFELSVRVDDSGAFILHDTKNVVEHADYSNLDQFIRRQIEYRKGREELKRIQPGIADRFPNLFPGEIKMKFWVQMLRRLFVYNRIWRFLIEHKIVRALPMMLRYFLYDLLISSTFLLSKPCSDEG